MKPPLNYCRLKFQFQRLNALHDSVFEFSHRFLLVWMFVVLRNVSKKVFVNQPFRTQIYCYPLRLPLNFSFYDECVPFVVLLPPTFPCNVSFSLPSNAKKKLNKYFQTNFCISTICCMSISFSSEILSVSALKSSWIFSCLFLKWNVHNYHPNGLKWHYFTLIPSNHFRFSTMMVDINQRILSPTNQ